uniref:hypothetical protein n=1 Tax=Prevotella sp. TaxID=59823 RepID=UPI0040268D6B
MHPLDNARAEHTYKAVLCSIPTAKDGFFEVPCEALCFVIYLAADNLLEMVFQVDTELEGIAKLGEGERLARRA